MPPPDWDDLRVLLAFERAGSLGGAARNLSIDKATVRRRIEALEEALGTRLVERRRDGWALTSDGSRAAEAALAMERELGELVTHVAGRDAALSGTVRLTAPVFFATTILIPALAGFREHYREIELRILASNAMVDLGRREADIAVRNIVPSAPNLVSRRLGMLGSAFYASVSYLEHRGEPTRAGLSAHHICSYDDRISFCADYAWVDEARATIAFRASDTVVLHDAVRAGVGIGILPCVVGDSDSSLRRLALAPPALEPIYAVFPEELRYVRTVRAVVDWVAQRFGEEQSRLDGSASAREP